MRQDRRILFDVRHTWQARALKGSSGKLAAVVLSVLSHNYDESLLPMLEIIYPGFSGIATPFISTAGRISRRGKVYADMVQRDGNTLERVVLFETEHELQNAFRALADRMKFSDADRLEMFAAVKRWIVCDYRLDPNTGEKERAA